MSQEIQVTLGLNVSKTYLKYQFPTQTSYVDLSGSRSSGGVQDIGTSNEQITISSDMSTVGWAVFTNTDSTNYVELGPNNTTPYMIRLNAGESCLFPLTQSTIYGRANTATVKLAYMIFER